MVEVEVFYTDFGFDETLCDTRVDSRTWVGHGMFMVFFDIPCNVFSLSLAVADSTAEIMIELCMVDSKSLLWIVQPKKTFDFLL